jgi:ribosome-binding protein aMBF1 (putative translation factor)
MTSRQIKRKLKDKGLMQKDLVGLFDSHPTTIHFLVNKKLRSAKLEKKLARLLGVTLQELRGEIPQQKAS